MQPLYVGKADRRLGVTGEEDVLICKCAKHLQIKTLHIRAAFFWFVFCRRGQKMNRKHPYKSKFEV